MICLLHKPLCLFSHYVHQFISSSYPSPHSLPTPTAPKRADYLTYPPPCLHPTTCPRPPAPKRAVYLTYPTSYSAPHSLPTSPAPKRVDYLTYLTSYSAPHSLPTSPAPKRAYYLTYLTSYSALPHPHPQAANLYNFYIIIQFVSFMLPYPLLLSPMQAPFPPPLPSFFSLLSLPFAHPPLFPLFSCPIRPLAQSIPYDSMPFILIIPAFLCASPQPAERPPVPTGFPNRLCLFPPLPPSRGAQSRLHHFTKRQFRI